MNMIGYENGDQIKLKTKYNTVRTVPKSNSEVVERGKMDTPNT